MSVLHALLAIISPSVCRPHGCKPPHTTNTTPQATPSGNKKAHTKSGKHKRDKAEDTIRVDTAPDEVMKRLASGDCLKLGIRLLLGLQLKFSDTHNTIYGLEDMYRMTLAMCCGKAPLPRVSIEAICFQTKHGYLAGRGCIKKSERCGTTTCWYGAVVWFAVPCQKTRHAAISHKCGNRLARHTTPNA